MTEAAGNASAPVSDLWTWFRIKLASLPLWPVHANTGVTKRPDGQHREFRVTWKEVLGLRVVIDVRFVDEKPGEFDDGRSP